MNGCEKDKLVSKNLTGLKKIKPKIKLNHNIYIIIRRKEENYNVTVTV